MAAIGIDLGTSWVRAAYQGKVVQLPAAVAFESGGRALVGEQALALGRKRPERCVLGAPRLVVTVDAGF